MQDVNVQKVLELLPRAFEIHREKTWELIKRHPEVIGLQGPVPPDVERLLKKQMRDLDALRKLRGTPTQLETNLISTSYKGRRKDPRKLCKVCKIVHEGKLPREHYVSCANRGAALRKWRAISPEAKQDNMDKMNRQRVANNYRRAIERRVKILHPAFVSKIGYMAAYHFVEKGIEQHGWDFLIFRPKGLIRQLSTEMGSFDLIRMRNKRHPGKTFADLIGMIGVALKERENGV